MKYLRYEHLTTEATCSVGSCFAFSHSVVVPEPGPQRVAPLGRPLSVEHLQNLFRNRENLEETL